MNYKRTPSSQDSTLQKTVSRIGKAIRQDGDTALKKYTSQFDKVNLNAFAVSPKEWKNALQHIDGDVKLAMQQAIVNIKKYHQHQATYLKQKPITTSIGIKCYRVFSPIERIGIYIPGGNAPLFSSVLMTVIPAVIAGCKEIIICTPPNKEGKIANEILFAAHATGCNKVYKLGGAQAIFAMAYGTKTIPAVYKIVGPGNSFVNEAKKQIAHHIPIDMPAGPSEVMIIADHTQPANIICSDLLAQLEHDINATAVLLATTKKTINQVKKMLPSMVEKAKRKHILDKSIHNLIVKNVPIPQAIKIANDYAPEHLIIAAQKASSIANQIKNAGSVFVGHFAAESIGDYASGTNHTLPTLGYAKNYSGLSVESFGKWTSFQEVNKKGFLHIAQTVKTMSGKEGLWEHQNAITLREQLIKNKMI